MVGCRDLADEAVDGADIDEGLVSPRPFREDRTGGVRMSEDERSSGCTPARQFPRVLRAAVRLAAAGRRVDDNELGVGTKSVLDALVAHDKSAISESPTAARTA